VLIMVLAGMSQGVIAAALLSLALHVDCAGDRDFVRWIDDGFCEDPSGLFESTDWRGRSRVHELLQRTEYCDFRYYSVSASPDGRQLRFWNYSRNDVVTVDSRQTRRISRPGSARIVLNTEGDCVATLDVNPKDRTAHVTVLNGATWEVHGQVWFDDSGEYFIRCDRGGYELLHMGDPDCVVATLTSRVVDGLARRGGVLFVYGRDLTGEPTGTWIERFDIEGKHIRRREFYLIPCPRPWFAMFSFIRDVSPAGDVLLVVQRGGFVSLLQYYVVRAPGVEATRLQVVDYGGWIRFLDRAEIGRIASRLDPPQAAKPPKWFWPRK
jgi:hypothetical protein